MVEPTQTRPRLTEKYSLEAGIEEGDMVEVFMEDLLDGDLWEKYMTVKGRDLI